MLEFPISPSCKLVLTLDNWILGPCTQRIAVMLPSINDHTSIMRVISLFLLAGEVHGEVLCLRTLKCGIAVH